MRNALERIPFIGRRCTDKIRFVVGLAVTVFGSGILALDALVVVTGFS